MSNNASHDRVMAYLYAKKNSQGNDHDHIHGISSGPEGMQSLFVSDIRKILREREEALYFIETTAKNMLKMVKVHSE